VGALSRQIPSRWRQSERSGEKVTGSIRMMDDASWQQGPAGAPVEEGQRPAHPCGVEAQARPAATPTVLVFIREMAAAERLVGAGRRLADVLRAGWIVACPVAAVENLADADRQRLQSILGLAEASGAEILTLADHGLNERIVALARRGDIAALVLEQAAPGFLTRWHADALLRALRRAAPQVDVIVVSRRGSLWTPDAPPHVASPGASPSRAIGQFTLAAAAWSVAVPVVATLVSTALFRRAEPTNHLIIYLLGILFVASRHGFWPSAVAAVLSVLASDFLLIAPYHSFAVARSEDLVTLAVFLLSAILASRLADRLRYQTEQALQREQRVRFLYEFTKALADVRSTDEVVAVTNSHLSRELSASCHLLLADPDGRLAAADASAGGMPFNAAAAQRAFETSDPVGWGTGSRPQAAPMYLPVSGASHRFGVLAVGSGTGQPVLQAEQRRLADALVSQVAQALERLRLAAEANAATAMAQTESLRNSLLNSIAHDFRTPLASIVTASSTLIQGKGRLSESQARELAQSILEEGQRMARLANNTLDMARLEAGNVRLRREWFPMDEIIGAVVTRMGARLRDRPLRTVLPEGEPLAQVDAVMVVQVLENLVENALKFAPEGSPIEIGAVEGPGDASFWVADCGPGIAPGEERLIFEKFHRGQGGETTSGVGLGLTICRIIVAAHGGHIHAVNRAAGGAQFRFTIPFVEPRPTMAAEENSGQAQ